MAGKATFGFTAKYQKGANIPTGETEFIFHIKIWDPATGQVLYDNKPGETDTSNVASALGGGSIAIHGD